MMIQWHLKCCFCTVWDLLVYLTTSAVKCCKSKGMNWFWGCWLASQIPSAFSGTRTTGSSSGAGEYGQTREFSDVCAAHFSSCLGQKPSPWSDLQFRREFFWFFSLKPIDWSRRYSRWTMRFLMTSLSLIYLVSLEWAVFQCPSLFESLLNWKSESLDSVSAST